jgi:hypothetical protein
MDEEHSRVEVGVFCLQCAGDIYECRVSDRGTVDHWYECECGCACVDCRQPMTFEERDTSSGTEYRAYRCAECGRAGIVRAGIAMWKAMEEWDAETSLPAGRASLGTLTAALERPPGSLREDTRLQELGTSFPSLMYAVHQASQAFQVTLPMDRLMRINTVGELLDLIEAVRGEDRT